MKISVNDQELFSINPTQETVIKHVMHEDIYDADMKRRVQWILMEFYNQSFKALKAEWEPRLAAAGVKSIPLDQDEFAQLVFSQPDYMNRKVRDFVQAQEEAKLAKEAADAMAAADEAKKAALVKEA